MISLRARIFILISVVLLIILAISVFLMMRFGKEKTATEPVNTSTGPLPSTSSPDTVPVGTSISSPGARQLSLEDIEKNAAKQLAKIFIERYGTYSSDNESLNIKEVENLVASALWSSLSAKIKSGPNGQIPGAEFMGMTTRVISAELKDWTGESAQAFLQTVRVEEKNGVTNNQHQNVEVNLVKQGENWLVQNFKWL